MKLKNKVIDDKSNRNLLLCHYHCSGKFIDILFSVIYLFRLSILNSFRKDKYSQISINLIKDKIKSFGIKFFLLINFYLNNFN
jgi:hypothetical protein